MEENKTDWRTILGMTLIFGILMFTFLYNQEEPLPEENTTEQSALELEKEVTATAPIVNTAATVVNDSIQQSIPTGKEVTLSNDLLDLKFNTKGAYITEALLKKFHTYDSLPVYLARGNDHSFDLILTAADGREIHTMDLVFDAPIVRRKQEEEQSRERRSSMEFVLITLSPEELLGVLVEREPQQRLLPLVFSGRG